jgi:hypothetical protein
MTPPRQAAEARPRSTAEILDDAWRLYLADPLLLLALTLLFWLPAVTCLVALLAEPTPSGPVRLLLPALTAFLLPLTGLAAGACQEVFHSWAEDYRVTLGECLRAALGRGLQHVASQALSLVFPVAALVCATSPALPGLAGVGGALLLTVLALLSSMLGTCRQAAFAAGQPRFWRAVSYSLRVSGGELIGRALIVVVTRGLMLIFAVFNLHLFGNFVLWAAESLGGFDVAYLSVLCSLGNAGYSVALVLLAWCLLTPYSEAANYLFFVDARTRFEGLDLWQRVEELFPPRPRGKVGAVLLALGLALAGAAPALAEEPLAAVRAARKDLAAIRDEVQDARPYPGGQRWVARLWAIDERLDKSKPDGYRWFRASLNNFPNSTQTQAVRLLDDADSQLALIEESLTRPRKTGAAEAPTKDYIKGLIPPDKHAGSKRKTEDVDQPKDKKDKPPPVDDDKPGNQGPGFGGKAAGPGVVGPTGLGLGNIAYALLIVLIGLMGAALLAGLAYVVYRWLAERSKAKPGQEGKLPANAAYLEDPDKQDPARLWRQADDLARAGDYLGAVRTLYLAVLALLHQGGLIRYERTRTNGEYADQLRPRPPLHQPFLGLTGLFEVKWYGQRNCESADYGRCRSLAEEIRAGSLRPEGAS